MTESAFRPADRSLPMEPTRNPEVSLSDLITVLLDKGTYLNLDLIISVADIPLIGVNLRATIAGMETMLEYGMMRDWDEKPEPGSDSPSRGISPLPQTKKLSRRWPGDIFMKAGPQRGALVPSTSPING